MPHGVFDEAIAAPMGMLSFSYHQRDEDFQFCRQPVITESAD
jgi:hypothetical protein